MNIISPDRLLAMYASGVFPMADGRSGPLLLFSPDPRTIIPLEDFHITHSLKKTWRAGRFDIRYDTCFERVMRECAARDDTWISEEIIRSYVLLHRQGNAHSVETWMDGELAGGLYGVALGGAFFGESMFHLRRDASKLALIALVERMLDKGMTLLDVQYSTQHLLTFGAKEIPRTSYLRLLEKAITQTVSFSD
ncbi:MAG: leucyl/phenylalanyl-tRNA--protein transferase [Bacteroidia bacterium]|nr:leucyl/phenylalanyl-tRNA--protein transferase [Bacteroidia bacterium]